MLNKFFKLEQKKTKVSIELIAGTTTFLAMAYILLVNPSVLTLADVPNMYLGDEMRSSIFVATALSAAFGSILMGVLANYPVALAPGMGVNAFVAYTVVLGLGYRFDQALAAVFISGILFTILSVTKLREIIINAIPISLKYAIGGGIGFFIGFIGLVNAGIIVSNPATLVGFGDLTNTSTLLALFGIFTTIILMARKKKLAVFIGMIATTIVGFMTGLIALPTGVVSMPPSIMPTLGMGITGLSSLFTLPLLSVVTVIFSLLFVDFFDTAGTLMAVGAQAGMIDEEGKLVNAEKALLADSLATVAGSVLGTSTVTSFVESTTGVEVGGRSGLTAVTTGVLFILSLFLWPLLSVLAGTSAITAPALITVGALMATSLGKVEWDKFEYSVPTFFCVIFMILTYSIAQGISVAFIMYVVIMAVTNRAKKVHPAMWALCVIFIIHYMTMA